MSDNAKKSEEWANGMVSESQIEYELDEKDAELTRLRAENEKLRAKKPKMFPLQISRHPEKTKPGPVEIPWEIAEFAYAAYSQQYGRNQTLERLAERGGFSWGEMDMLYPSWRVESNAFTTLRAALAAAEAERDAATEGMSLLVLAEYCTEQSVRAHDDGDWKYWRDQRGRVCELAKKIPVVRAMMDKYLEGTGENASAALAKEKT